MTTEQKNRIASLRSAGQGYTAIARELGLSKSAISNGLTSLPPRFIRHRRRFGSAPNRCERCALAMWSSLQQNYEAVFKPLKPLISKERKRFSQTRGSIFES